MEKRFLKETALPITVFVSLLLAVLASTAIIAAEVSGDDLTLWSYAIPQLAILLTVVLYFSVTRLNFAYELPIFNGAKPKKFVWAALAQVGFLCLGLLPTTLITLGFDALGLNPTVTIPELSGVKNILLTIIIICILPVLGEEILFRGVAVRALRDYGIWRTMLIGGAVFALYHMNLAQTVYQFFVGATLCFIAIRTKNLCYVMLMHLLNNVIAVFLPVAFPIFARLALDGTSIAVLVSMFVAGLFIFPVALRQLVSESGSVKENFVEGFRAFAAIFKKDGLKIRLKAFDQSLPMQRKIAIPTWLTLLGLGAMWAMTLAASL